MTVFYLCGPMANYPEHNHPAFHAAAADLRAAGYQIISPAEYGNLVSLGFVGALKRDIHALLWCEAVIVLPGWERSKGATLECNLASDLEMQVFELATMLSADDSKYRRPLFPSKIQQTYLDIHGPATTGGIWPDRIGQRS